MHVCRNKNTSCVPIYKSNEWRYRWDIRTKEQFTDLKSDVEHIQKGKRRTVRYNFKHVFSSHNENSSDIGSPTTASEGAAIGSRSDVTFATKQRVRRDTTVSHPQPPEEKKRSSPSSLKKAAKHTIYLVFRTSYDDDEREKAVNLLKHRLPCCSPFHSLRSHTILLYK